MITERHEELAALYVLGLLEGEELRVFETELAGNRELAQRVTELTEATATLALTAPPVPPPAALRARVLDAVAERPLGANQPVARKPAAGGSFTLLQFLPWGVAAGLALLAGVLGSRYAAVREENQALRDERQKAEAAFLTTRDQLTERSVSAERLAADLAARLRRSEDLARLKVSALVATAGNTPEARAIAVWDPDQQSGMLTFDKLPVIAQTQDYQVWVVDPAYPNPVNGGVFQVDANGRATLSFKPDQPVRAAAAIAVSLEKKGGVPKAEGPIVLLGNVNAL